MVQPSSSSILLRKRTSDSSSRRRSGQLGAVKRVPSDENRAPEVAAEPSGQPNEPEEAPATQLAHAADAAPPAAEEQQGGAAAAADNAPTARFQKLLVESNAAERWFEDQLTPKAAPGLGPRPSGNGSLSSSAAASAGPVQSAASQIVDKALSYLTSERAMATMPSPMPANMFKLDSASFLDKGLDAIKGVANLMETFTTTLDGFIGQALEEWGTPKSAERPRPMQPHNSCGSSRSSKAAPHQHQHEQQQLARKVEQGAGKGARSIPALKQTHMTAFMSRMTDASEEDIAEWQKRAVGLQAELQKLQSQIEENQRLRDAYTKMQQDLEHTASAVSKLEQENTLLKQQSAQQGAESADVEDVDPLAAEQVRHQMEVLLTEKAKLAQENARLLRENTGLQELLEFTMLAQAEMVGDDELFNDDHSVAAWSAPSSSSGGEASPCSTEGCANRPVAAALAQLAL
ncbi:hypothetical protein N2152v2_002471 [Parachlorella kessleri]